MISSYQLLFTMPCICSYFIGLNFKKVTPDKFEEEDVTILNHLQDIAKCSLRQIQVSEPKLDKIIKYHADELADCEFGLSQDKEHDPTEFITRFLEYVDEKISVLNPNRHITMDLFQTKIKTDAVQCQE
jgi:hypothetical protein